MKSGAHAGHPALIPVRCGKSSLPHVTRPALGDASVKKDTSVTRRRENVSWKRNVNQNQVGILIDFHDFQSWANPNVPCH